MTLKFKLENETTTAHQLFGGGEAGLVPWVGSLPVAFIGFFT